ncbi:hypothetical protein TRFO_22153 [Tritrichomonas foetus]|uniref:Surface antigen BspA-like n=1 Tax=Tritrichomonas foetus TaxID=1144522 RepID=A0A1J4KE03_9EUKA|nr:hypothetical protein TRFO_22153 [Tritrichomonas foetus]|eukprot:OHT09136.1 hypothetical protein TRFO_22153 [Tritrichomonas foetus]
MFFISILTYASFTHENIRYESQFNDNIIAVEAQNNISELHIPSTIEYESVLYRVVGIENNVFYGMDYYGELVLPESLVYINEYAFSNCKGFTGSLVIPENLTMIGSFSFSECTGFSGDLVFRNPCTIGNNAFYLCFGFKGSLQLHNQMTYLNNNIFDGCSGFTGDLIIPEFIEFIGIEAFKNCAGFTRAIYNGTNILFQSDSAANSFEQCYFRCVFVVEEYNYHYFNELPAIKSDTIINDDLIYFYENSTHELSLIGCISNNEREIIIPSSLEILVHEETAVVNVTSIVQGVFAYCSNFYGKLSIPNTITTIQSNTFRECTGFSHLELPDSITSIGSYSFFRCERFTQELILPTNLIFIGQYAFMYCHGFYGDLIIPENITSIVTYTFGHCYGFNGSLVLPFNLSIIQSYGFYNCYSFSGNLVFPNSIISIGYNAFTSCSNFSGSLDFPNKTTTISIGAFSFCSGFNETLTLPLSLTSIGNLAFAECTGIIKAIYLGTQLSIYTDIFRGTTFRCIHVPSDFLNDTLGYLPAVKPDDIYQNNLVYRVLTLNISEVTLFGCEIQKREEVVIPSVIIYQNIQLIVRKINNYAFYSCYQFNNNLIIPNTINEIGANSFYYCYSFSGKLTLSNNILSIGNSAFEGCSNITGVVFPSVIKSIGIYSFYYCTKLRVCQYEGIIEPSISSSAFSYTLISSVGVTSHYENDTFGGKPVYYYDTLPTSVFTFSTEIQYTKRRIFLESSFFIYYLLL